MNYFFLNSANLICRGTDISKYFGESHGIRDNESRLYLMELQTVLTDQTSFRCILYESIVYKILGHFPCTQPDDSLYIAILATTTSSGKHVEGRYG